MPVPGITYLKLTSANTGVDAGAERNFCPIWTWCSFTVKDGWMDKLISLIEISRTKTSLGGVFFDDFLTYLIVFIQTFWGNDPIFDVRMFFIHGLKLNHQRLMVTQGFYFQK